MDSGLSHNLSEHSARKGCGAWRGTTKLAPAKDLFFQCFSGFFRVSPYSLDFKVTSYHKGPLGWFHHVSSVLWGPDSSVYKSLMMRSLIDRDPIGVRFLLCSCEEGLVSAWKQLIGWFMFLWLEPQVALSSYLVHHIQFRGITTTHLNTKKSNFLVESMVRTGDRNDFAPIGPRQILDWMVLKGISIHRGSYNIATWTVRRWDGETATTLWADVLLFANTMLRAGSLLFDI